METCAAHTELASNVAVILTKLENIEARMCLHVTEGERVGGWRDRLLCAEKEISVMKLGFAQEISAIKKGYWKACITAGLIGGLLGKLTPDAFSFIVGLLK